MLIEIGEKLGSTLVLVSFWLGFFCALKNISIYSLEFFKHKKRYN